MQKVLWSPWATTLHQQPAALPPPPLLPNPLLHFCFRVTTRSARDPVDVFITAGKAGRRPTEGERTNTEKTRGDFQESSAFLSPEYFIACMPKAPHIHSHVRAHTLHKSPSAHTHARVPSCTHTRERGARMNTQRTGVPGAGVFSEQSDIYRKGKECVCVGGGGGVTRGEVEGKRRRRKSGRSVMIPAVLTN